MRKKCNNEKFLCFRFLYTFLLPFAVESKFTLNIPSFLLDEYLDEGKFRQFI